MFHDNMESNNISVFFLNIFATFKILDDSKTKPKPGFENSQRS